MYVFTVNRLIKLIAGYVSLQVSIIIIVILTLNAYDFGF